MERYSDVDEAPRRPDLGQKIADYHLGLAAGLGECAAPPPGPLAARPLVAGQLAARLLTLSLVPDEETRAAALEALERSRSASPSLALTEVCSAMHVRMEASRLEPLHVLTLSGCSPELTFAGRDPTQAAQAALGYLRRALQPEPAGSVPIQAL